MPKSKNITAKKMDCKRKKISLKRKVAMTTIGCSAVVSGISSCNGFSTQSVGSRPSVSPYMEQTRLQFRNGNEDDSQERKLDRPRHVSLLSSVRGSAQRWNLNSMLQKQKDEFPKEQKNIDEYLEFLDRRFNRLHSEEKLHKKSTHQERVRQRVNTAWSWIFDSDESSKNSDHVNESRQEDALYVLGVAELASSRLLQKHQLMTQSRKPPQIHVGSISTGKNVPATKSKFTENDDKFDQDSSVLEYRPLSTKLASGSKFWKNLQKRKGIFCTSKMNSLLRILSRSSSVICFKILTVIRAQAYDIKKRIQATSLMALSMVMLLSRKDM